MALKVVKSQNTVLPHVAVSTAVVVEPEVVLQKTLVEPGVSDIEALVSEYIELHKKFEYFEVKSMVKRMDDLRKQLQSLANETMDPKKVAVFSSPAGEVEFSERGKASIIPYPLQLVQDLLDKFGPEVTASVVGIAITPLRKILSEAELSNYLVEEPGGRTLKSVRPVK